MKQVLLTLLCFFALRVGADPINRFECVYGDFKGTWYGLEQVFDVDNYSIQPSEVIQGFAGWTGDGQVNYALCSTMTGTIDPNRVIINTSTYKADWFDAVEDCNVTGQNVELLQTVSKTIGRGEHSDIQVPWTGQYQHLGLNVYFPKIEELSDVPQGADDACARITPR